MVILLTATLIATIGAPVGTPFATTVKWVETCTPTSDDIASTVRGLENERYDIQNQCKSDHPTDRSAEEACIHDEGYTLNEQINEAKKQTCTSTEVPDEPSP